MSHQPADWVPLRWPAEWKTEQLTLLENTPFNCLVAGEPSTGLAEAAAKRNVSVVQLGKDVDTAPVTKLSDAGSREVIAISDANWPGIPPRKPGEGGESGPTGLPWVDSNGWVIQLARAKARGKALWIDAPPPKDGPGLRSGNYSLAVADSGAYGARWIVTLEQKTASGIATANEAAMKVWRDTSQAAAFFEKQKSWRAMKPAGTIGVVSDFEGPNEFLGTELLNLMPRRQMQYRVVDRGSASAADLAGLKSVVWVDAKAPSGPWAAAVKEIVSRGGMLIGATSIQHFADGLKPSGVFDGRYNLYALGSGKLAIARKPWSDPYEVAADSHLLVSRRQDSIRLWNSSSINAAYMTGSNGQAVVHILNFATRLFGGLVTLFVAHPYRTAKWWTISGASEELAASRKQDGVEVAIPNFEAYGAVEFGV